jgi:hypothetical protein
MVKSSKPGKQRKAQANAPMHIRRRNITARLMLDSPDDRLAHVRSATVASDTPRPPKEQCLAWMPPPVV